MDDFERRLQRAKYHLDWLKVQVEKRRGLQNNMTKLGPKVKAGGYVLLVAEQKPIPPIFGLVAAEAIHNLRAMLDNLAWAIAKPVSIRENRRYHFPLYEKSAQFRKFKKEVLKGMPRDRVDAYKRHQPYKRSPSKPADDDLVLLDKLWIADKHYAPFAVTGWPQLMVGSLGYGDDIPSEPPFYFNPGPLGKNGEVGWVSTASAERNVNPRISLDIGFQARDAQIAISRYRLRKIYNIVAKEVLPDFRSFL